MTEAVLDPACDGAPKDGYCPTSTYLVSTSLPSTATFPSTQEYVYHQGNPTTARRHTACSPAATAYCVEPFATLGCVRALTPSHLESCSCACCRTWHNQPDKFILDPGKQCRRHAACILLPTCTLSPLRPTANWQAKCTYKALLWGKLHQAKSSTLPPPRPATSLTASRLAHQPHQPRQNTHPAPTPFRPPPPFPTLPRRSRPGCESWTPPHF